MKDPMRISSDECYTPFYAVTPILEYIEKHYHDKQKKGKKKKKLIIWTPFDTKRSEFVIQLSKIKYVKVVRSHIDEGKDFYKYQPKKWDIIISNPPFKGKREIFERALSFHKPFALIMTNSALNDKYPLWCWEEYNKQFQILKFDKRMKFVTPQGGMNNKVNFSSSYFCCDFLPKDFIQKKIFVR